MPAGVSRSWQGHPCRQGSSGPAKNKGRLNPQDPPRKSRHGNWRTRGRSELRYTVTAAHTSTTLASVAGVRRVRTRGRGACLNRPAREEKPPLNNRQRSRKNLRGNWRTRNMNAFSQGWASQWERPPFVPYSWDLLWTKMKT
jgi:hypothetical protein